MKQRPARPYNPRHHAHMVVWNLLKAGGEKWRGIDARKPMVPTVEAALSHAYERGASTNGLDHRSMEVGMLVALGNLAALHNSPAMARDVAVCLGLAGTDVSELEDYDKELLRLLDLPLTGLTAPATDAA